MNEIDYSGIVVKMEGIKEILPDEYFYSCLPLCVIDAIFSIGANYKSTRNTVKRFANHMKITIDRRDIQAKEQIFLIDNLNDVFKNCKTEEDYEKVADEVFGNKQKTSSKSGITKAQAVHECAKLFRENGIQTIDDFNKKYFEIEDKYKEIKGQRSGVSFDYLCMLCGYDDKFKYDRQIKSFFAEEYQEINADDRKEVEKAMKIILESLKPKYPKMTMRYLDYIIWNYQRSR